MAEITHVDRGGSVDAGALLGGDWGTVSRSVVPGGESRSLDGDEAERACYVLAGTGRAAIDGDTVDLRPGVALTVTSGSGLTITAGEQDLELFEVSLGGGPGS